MRAWLRRGHVWVGLGGTALFLGLFFWQVDISHFWQAMKGADYIWAVPAVALWFLAAWARSLRWGLILRPVAPLSLRALYPVLVIGYMANNLLPARLGELIRAYILGERYGVGKVQALGTVAVERVTDGLTLVGLLAVGAMFVEMGGVVKALAWANLGLFLGGFLVLSAALMKREAALRFMGLLARPLPAPWRAKVVGAWDAFIGGLESLRSPGILIGALCAGTVAWVLEAAMYYLVGKGFGLEGDPALYLVLAGAANLAVALPSTSGGIGPFEWATQQVMVGAQTSRGVAAAYAVALHGLLLIPVIIAGLAFLWATQLPVWATLEKEEVAQVRDRWAG